MPRVFSTQGTVSDGGGVALMTALVVPPDGILRVEPVTLGGADWTFTPLLDQLGEYLIQITATDLAGNISSVGLFTLLVTNRPPLAVNDSYATTADVVLLVAAPGVLANDEDLDSDPLSVVAYDAVSALDASVVISPDGSLSYDPTVSAVLTAMLPGDSLLDTFEYTVDDSAGNTARATVSVLVGGMPQAVTLVSFEAEAQAGQVLVSWETVSELDNIGFNLYRGLEADGGDRTLLASVPSQSPGSSQGASYTYADADVTEGETYWYWLEDVDLSGAATLHGPVSATVGAPTAVTLVGFDVAGHDSRLIAFLGLIARWLMAVGGRTPGTSAR